MAKIRAELESTISSIAKEFDLKNPIEFKLGASIDTDCGQDSGKHRLLVFDLDNLTQMMTCVEKEKAESGFMRQYRQCGIVKESPYTIIDPEGVL